MTLDPKKVAARLGAEHVGEMPDVGGALLAWPGWRPRSRSIWASGTGAGPSPPPAIQYPLGVVSQGADEP